MEMKIFVLVIFMMVVSKASISQSQWTNSSTGGHIYNTNSGNVGIGTTNPQSSLHVMGDIEASHRLYTDQGTDALGAVHFALRTGNTFRFGLGLTNSETGSNQGSDFSVWRYADDGNYIANAFFIKRNTGAVGIGNASPEALLHVNGESRFNGSGWFSRTNNGNSAVALKLGQNRDWDYHTLELSTYDDGGTSYSNWFATRWANYVNFSRASSTGTKNIFEIGGSDGEQYTSIYSVDGSTIKIKLSADGTSYVQNNLAVGTTNTQGYKLAVNGDAIFTKAKVKLFNTWPDYVFHPSYKLLSLKELEEYIKENSHLPGVASAKEVEQKGLDLGDSQAILLRKIEELTLYIIDQDKKIASQEKEIKDLKSYTRNIEDLSKQIEILKNLLSANKKQN